MNADGTGVRQLTRNRGPGDGFRRIDQSPSWSPDGRRIAFASNRDGQFEIYVMNGDGTDVRRVTRRSARWQESQSPDWSPDGRLIAFASTRAGFFNLEVYVVRPDGSGLRRLTRTKGSDGVLGDDGTPAWSPAGKRIAFASNRDQNNELYVMNADGSRERRLTRTPELEAAPAWSPDGTKLVYAVMAQGKPDRVVISAPDGGRRVLAEGSEPDWRP